MKRKAAKRKTAPPPARASSLDALCRGMAKRVLQRRLELGLSQTELARRAGMASVSLWRIERGHQIIRIQTLQRLPALLEEARREAAATP